jgi:predicted HTH transcriptional regulator
MKKSTETSKKAYKKNKKNFVSREQKLLNFMNKGISGTAGEFAKRLKIPRNECAKRLSDLFTDERCTKVGKKVCSVTKNYATIYGVN